MSKRRPRGGKRTRQKKNCKACGYKFKKGDFRREAMCEDCYKDKV